MKGVIKLNSGVRYFKTDILYLLASLAALCAVAFLLGFFYGIVSVLLSVVYCAVYVYFAIYREAKLQKLVEETISQKDTLPEYIDPSSIPAVLVSQSGSIKWYNEAFGEIAERKFLFNINSIFPGIKIPDKEKKTMIKGRPFKKELYHIKYGTSELLLYRLIDVENAVEAKKLYQNFLPVICYMQIDNYEELATDVSQTELSEIVAAVEKRISEMTKSISAVFMKTDRGKYLCMFERRYLSTLRASKFRILDDIRQINTAVNLSVSIAIGVGETPEQSADFAGKALDLALGRGGNQAIIKQTDKFIFFGGTLKTPFRRSKVKSRMVSRALRNLMEQSGEVFIMGHTSPDLDCMGASLGIAACARSVKKRVYIVLDKPNPSIEPLLHKLLSTDLYAPSIVSGQEAALRVTRSSMLIIVDTQLASYTVSPGLIKQVETVAVIDHHLKGANSIEDTALSYHEPNASSVSELVTEIMQYFGDDIKPLEIELEALLCGLTIDTKGFTFNTGARTFEAASYLKSSGAESGEVIKLVQDDIKTYTGKAEIVKNAEILDNGVAIAICPKMENSALVSAQAADALLTIKGVYASFVISESDGGAAISGRSLGDINVQLILESLGGGGHATMAAVKMDGVDSGAARDLLKETIKNYISED